MTSSSSKSSIHPYLIFIGSLLFATPFLLHPVRDRVDVFLSTRVSSDGERCVYDDDMNDELVAENSTLLNHVPDDLKADLYSASARNLIIEDLVEVNPEYHADRSASTLFAALSSLKHQGAQVFAIDDFAQQVDVTAFFAPNPSVPYARENPIGVEGKPTESGDDDSGDGWVGSSNDASGSGDDSSGSGDESSGSGDDSSGSGSDGSGSDGSGSDGSGSDQSGNQDGGSGTNASGFGSGGSGSYGSGHGNEGSGSAGSGYGQVGSGDDGSGSGRGASSKKKDKCLLQ